VENFRGPTILFSSSSMQIIQRLDTDDSNSSKLMADSSEVFQTFFGPSELFRLTHTPSGLPDCHHHPQSRSQLLLWLLQSPPWPVFFLLNIESDWFSLSLSSRWQPNLYTKIEQKKSDEQFPIPGPFLLQFQVYPRQVRQKRKITNWSCSLANSNAERAKCQSFETRHAYWRWKDDYVLVWRYFLKNFAAKGKSLLIYSF